MSTSGGGITYSVAGVDIDRGDSASRMAAGHARTTFLAGVEERFGVVLMDLLSVLQSYTRPKLITAADGVGTKLKLAFMSGKHDTVGIDLVAMVVNDLLRRGAKPLGLLCYLATSRIDLAVADALYRSVAQGCQLGQCSYLGGETAEMPDFYSPGEYDMAGFAFGVVEDGQEITGERITEGDVIIGLPSVELHSNGYSLVRRVLLPKYGLDARIPELGDRLLIDVLLEPTKIYTQAILLLVSKIEVHGIAHITGSGLTGKVGKILPKGLTAVIHRNRWQPHAIFDLVQREGNVAEDEMFRTFNMGFGMVAILPLREAQSAIDILVSKGESPVEIGAVVNGSGGVRYM